MNSPQTFSKKLTWGMVKYSHTSVRTGHPKDDYLQVVLTCRISRLRHVTFTYRRTPTGASLNVTLAKVRTDLPLGMPTMWRGFPAFHNRVFLNISSTPVSSLISLTTK